MGSFDDATARTPTSSPNSSAASLGSHQRHDAERAGLHLNLGHHGVLGHLGDQSGEPVPRALLHRRAQLRSPGDLLGMGWPDRRRRWWSRPPPVLAFSRPESTQRRTVSSETPSSAAACEIRYCGTTEDHTPQARRLGGPGSDLRNVTYEPAKIATWTDGNVAARLERAKKRESLL